MSLLKTLLLILIGLFCAPIAVVFAPVIAALGVILFFMYIIYKPVAGSPQ